MKSYTETIETNRLILRKFKLSDSKCIFSNYANDDEVTKYLTWNTYKSEGDAIAYLTNFVLPDYENEYTYRWAVVLKQTNEVIGCIDVVDKNLKTKCAELGYVLGRAYWNKGLMTEAGKPVIDYLFSEGFERIQALHHVENVASGKVMQKLGMSYEGTLRKFAKNNKGELVDTAIYSVIKSNR